jgi:L-2,4-diaminobutyrate decarboxylase
MNPSESNIPYPFSPDEFRKEGHIMVDTLSDYLQQVLFTGDIPVLPDNNPDKLAEIFSFESGSGECEPLNVYIKRIIDHSIHIHHPGYIGHQVTSPFPVTALVQFCTTLLNNAAAVYEMGPVNMAMEKNVVEYFGSLIGYRNGCDGIFTHGGTAGNLTAMLTARQKMTSYNIWEEGVKEEQKPGFMITDQAHYSIGRNVKIMGLGEESAVKIPCDEQYRMRINLLEDYKKRAEDKGIKIICVVASACSTSTGTYDKLDGIAAFCEKYGLWMHVDGAHGMGVLFSDKYKYKVKGIDRADSVVIDFHKMFLVPALNTLVMFRNGESSYETFSQKASYLFKNSKNNSWYESAIRTIECTKSALGIIAYTAIKYYGKNYYREYIESRYDLAASFATLIKTNNHLELAIEPDANIICFRYIKKGLKEDMVNQINASVREKIVKEGSFYIVQTEVNGKLFLRLTIINPVTSINDLKKLLIKVIDYGTECLQ